MKCNNHKHLPYHQWHGYEIATHEDVIKCAMCGEVWHQADNIIEPKRIKATRVLFSDTGYKYIHDALKVHHAAIPEEIIIALADACEKFRAHYEDECDDDLGDQNRFAYDTKHGDGAHAVLTGKQIQRTLLSLFNTASTGDDLPF